MPSDMKKISLWRAVFSELLGTTIFLFLVTAVLIHQMGGIVPISFAIGLSIAILAHIFGPISGGHFNPAVTFGAIVTGDISVLRAVFYLLAQLVGGITGSSITYALNPASKRGHLGNVVLGKGYTVVQGFFMEFLLTAVLVLTFLASTDNSRKDFGFANALAVGLVVTLAHLVGIPYTGSGINPARAFGPAVIVNIWPTYHWIYWLAPFAGGIVAGIVYRYVIKEDEEEYSSVALESDESPLIEDNKISLENFEEI